MSAASTTIEDDTLVRFESSRLLQENAIRLRQAAVRRCADLTNLLRVISHFVLKLLELHLLIDSTTAVLPAKMVSLLKHSSLSLLCSFLGEPPLQCRKLNGLLERGLVTHL